MTARKGKEEENWDSALKFQDPKMTDQTLTIDGKLRIWKTTDQIARL